MTDTDRAVCSGPGCPAAAEIELAEIAADNAALLALEDPHNAVVRAEQERRMAEHVSRALKLAEAHPCAPPDVVRRTRLLQFILDGPPD